MKVIHYQAEVKIASGKEVQLCFSIIKTCLSSDDVTENKKTQKVHNYPTDVRLLVLSVYCVNIIC